MLAQSNRLLSKSPGRQSFHWQCNVSVLIPWYRGPQSQWKGTGTCSEAVHQRSLQCVPIASDQCILQRTFSTGEGQMALWSNPCLQRFECCCQGRAAEPVLFHRDLWHHGHVAAIYHQPLSFPNRGLSHDNTECHCSFTDLVPG